ncbi:aminobenzoyl-glutamate transport protein [Alkalithermobacter thermoalcaliphilus JW-YL-7 = DSM 7308]|uniref:AbgT transporter n=1 Tax=Alkalithermobacter thermoalcaliphilus JW-YL-7 = DSM 7308 TaxID=1121328 RepID=A0A150FPG9_CLOPD|nr:AbgT transporter [[Clostridium] paradoxum JW-YL-7 = DSM 7308]SHK50906.1 aminobenzoyl-glutamate transport protein [[Clostridium] paradoxum JW-YL-7 = DSM 7308]
MSTKQLEQPTKKSLFGKFLDMIEKVGNALPHPVTLFFIFALAVVIISDIAARAGLSVQFDMIDRSTGEIKEATVGAVSLLNPDGIRFIFSKAVSNFTGFAPLGTVLVAMLGVGVAEGTGLISALLRKVVLNTPKRAITAVVVFLGIMSNIASDAGYVVLVPLGAIIFLSFGRHPLAGLAAAFAGVSGGFSANLLIGTVDPLLGGLSTEAAKILDPNYSVAATANWYFMIVSTFVITIIGTWITEKVVEPRLGEYKGEEKVELKDLTAEEKKGLNASLISLLVYVAVIAALVVPSNGILRNPETGEILEHSAFMDGIVPIIMGFFLIPGVAYGIASKTIKDDKDVANAMGKAMGTMGGYLVLSFVAAQFIAYFNYSNLGTILAVKGAELLENIGFTGLPLIIAFILVSAFINLFIGSASAKWAIMAPVFVPMFMRLGYTPEFTQVAYRIGDSTTNIISPLMSYFAVIVAFAQKYDKKTGIGTLISSMVPYSIAFLLGWTVLLIIWSVLGLPIGPGAFMRM